MKNCIQPLVINAAKTHNRPCSPEAYACVVYARPTSLPSCGERHAIAWYLPDPSSSGPKDGAGLGLGSRLLQCGHSGRRVVRMWRSTQRGQIEKLGKQAACVPLTAADRRPHNTQTALDCPGPRLFLVYLDRDWWPPAPPIATVAAAPVAGRPPPPLVLPVSHRVLGDAPQ